MQIHCFHRALIRGYLRFSLSGKNTLHLKFAAHSHVVTWETKRKTTTKTKHSINTIRVVPSLHSKWAFTLVRLSYAESKNCEFYESQKFWCRPKPPGVAGGWKQNAGRQWLCYCSAAAVANKETTKNGSMFSHCCKISKFENPILRLQEAERIKKSHQVPW